MFMRERVHKTGLIRGRPTAAAAAARKSLENVYNAIRRGGELGQITSRLWDI